MFEDKIYNNWIYVNSEVDKKLIGVFIVSFFITELILIFTGSICAIGSLPPCPEGTTRVSRIALNPHGIYTCPTCMDNSEVPFQRFISVMVWLVFPIIASLIITVIVGKYYFNKKK